jgi:hypothetical protein
MGVRTMNLKVLFSICLLFPASVQAQDADKNSQDNEPAVREPALRKELLVIEKVDQEARGAFYKSLREKGISLGEVQSITDPAQMKVLFEQAGKMEAIDKKNRDRLKEIVDEHGWPGRSLVGKDGAHAAWLVVQHAVADLDFMRRCRDLMKAAPQGDVEPMQVAHMTDRVLVKEKKKQTYGTELNVKFEPEPIEDEANVDKRREEVGLMPLAEYLKVTREAYEKASNAQKIPTKIAGAFKEGELVELQVRGRIAYLIKPTAKVDPQKRWVWDFPFWLAINDGFGHVAHRYYVEQLLAAGFHIAGVNVGPSCGSPAAAEVCQEFYEQLVSQHGLHKRARVLSHSHGGLIAYGWAFRHPNCVDRIAGMCPATDFRTYPTLPNVVAGPTKGLDYGLSLEQLDRRSADFNPIDNLAPLAKAQVKILHIHGDQDVLVPVGANSQELARRYHELRGDAEIVLLKDLGAERANSRGHDGPELYESAALLKFLVGD